jgi:hypothetical protein
MGWPKKICFGQALEDVTGMYKIGGGGHNNNTEETNLQASIALAVFIFTLW